MYSFQDKDASLYENFSCTKHLYHFQLKNWPSTISAICLKRLPTLLQLQCNSFFEREAITGASSITTIVTKLLPTLWPASLGYLIHLWSRTVLMTGLNSNSIYLTADAQLSLRYTHSIYGKRSKSDRSIQPSTQRLQCETSATRVRNRRGRRLRIPAYKHFGRSLWATFATSLSFLYMGGLQPIQPITS